VHVAWGNPAAIAATQETKMSKEQKLNFIRSLRFEGLKVVRKDGRIIVSGVDGLVCMVEPKPNGSVEISRCGAGSRLVKECLVEALA
jgi:predicted nucleotidyltransferase